MTTTSDVRLFKVKLKTGEERVMYEDELEERKEVDEIAGVIREIFCSECFDEGMIEVGVSSQVYPDEPHMMRDSEHRACPRCQADAGEYEE